MSFSSAKTLQLLQRRSFHQWNQISRIAKVTSNPVPPGGIHRVSTRNFGHGKSRIFEHWARNAHKWADAAKTEAKANGGKYGKYGGARGYYGNFYGRHGNGHGHHCRDFVRMCRRYHGYGHWKGGIWGGISFGSALSIVISYHNYQSIIWAMIHGFLSWIYVIYYALSEYNSQEKSANELIEAQMKEVSVEIEKLNRIYTKIVKEIDDENGNAIKNKAILGQSQNTQNDDLSNYLNDNKDDFNRRSLGTHIPVDEFEQNKQKLEELRERIDKLQNEVDNKE